MAAYRSPAPHATRGDRQQARRTWQVARTRREAVVATVERTAKAAAAVALPSPDGLEEIQGALAPEEALVLYGLVREEALALVGQSDGARIVRIGLSAPLLDAADRLRRPPEGRDVRGRLLLEGEPPTTDSPLDLVSARRHLTQPLALPESVTRVLISPVGRLGYVPFALLLPDREVVYVPSGTTWRLLRREEQAEEVRGRKVLGFGDPDYASKVDEAALRIRRGGGPHLARLPATRKEVELVADERYLDEQATETKLHEVVRTQERWRAVHFACHGLVDPEHPMLSALALTADVENDGFLTALESLTMRIPADLVVLSACETGKGRIYRTEGILGLARSFMFAGTPRVLCSLWKVDDAAALERAQAYVRSHEQWEHPYYWAAWVLWGLD